MVNNISPDSLLGPRRFAPGYEPSTDSLNKTLSVKLTDTYSAASDETNYSQNDINADNAYHFQKIHSTFLSITQVVDENGNLTASNLISFKKVTNYNEAEAKKAGLDFATLELFKQLMLMGVSPKQIKNWYRTVFKPTMSTAVQSNETKRETISPEVKSADSPLIPKEAQERIGNFLALTHQLADYLSLQAEATNHAAEHRGDIGELNKHIRRVARVSHLTDSNAAFFNMAKIKETYFKYLGYTQELTNLKKSVEKDQEAAEADREATALEEQKKDKHITKPAREVAETRALYAKPFREKYGKVFLENVRRYGDFLAFLQQLEETFQKQQYGEVLEHNDEFLTECLNDLEALKSDYFRYRGNKPQQPKANATDAEKANYHRALLAYNQFSAQLRAKPIAKLVLDHYYQTHIHALANCQPGLPEYQGDYYRLIGEIDITVLEKYIKQVKQTGNLANVEEENAEWTRKYAWLPFSDLTLPEQERRRKLKNGYYQDAKRESSVIAVGEGAVAFAFFYKFMNFAGWALAVGSVFGICAALINFTLFFADHFFASKDLRDKELRDRRFLTDKDGNPVTGWRKGAIYSLTIFSAGAGIAFGFISFHSMTGILMGLFTLVGLGPIAPYIVPFIALYVAAISAKALGSVFYCYAVKFVRDKEYSDNLKTLYKNFIGIWQDPNLSTVQKIGSVFIRGIFFIGSIAAAITVCITTLGVGMDAAFSFFMSAPDVINNFINIVPPMSAELASTLSKIFIIGLSSIVNGFFYTCGAFKVLGLVRDLLLSGFIKLTNWLSPDRNPTDVGKTPLSAAEMAQTQNTDPNPYRDAQLKKTFWVRVGAVICALTNGFAQGTGGGGSDTALRWVGIALGEDGAKAAATATMAAGSTGGNGKAAWAASAQPLKVENSGAMQAGEKWIAATHTNQPPLLPDSNMIKSLYRSNLLATNAHEVQMSDLNQARASALKNTPIICEAAERSPSLEVAA